MNNQKAIKKRNWGFIMYPDSAPSDWKSILENTGLKIAVSPLHDKDIKDSERPIIPGEQKRRLASSDEQKNLNSLNGNSLMSSSKTGVFKKAHWHVLLHFDGPTTYNVVSSISASVCGTAPIAVQSLKGSYEYLTHVNNPEKAQYSSDDITLLNGFRIESLAELSSDDIVRLKKNIQKLIIDLDIFEYSDLMDYLLLNDLDPEYRLASSSTIFFAKLIDSRRHKYKKK